MTSTEDFEEKSKEIKEKTVSASQCREYFGAQTSQDLKKLLRRDEIEIEDVLAVAEGLTTLEKNQVALIYYSSHKLPFLLGHKVKYGSSDSIALRNGIICGIIVGRRDIDPGKLWIYDEDSGTIHHIPLDTIRFSSKRTNCHHDIKGKLEQLVNNPDYDEALLLVPRLSSQHQNNDDEDDNDSDRIIMDTNPAYTRPRLFTREDTRTPWYELVNPDQPLYKVVEELFRLFTVFEHEDIVLPIVVAASCQPSAISNYTQIGIFFGVSGSGKSSCCHVIEGLYDIPKVLSSITYPGFRNHMDENRYIVSTEYTGEKNLHVVIDEAGSAILEDPKFYTLLKGGVSIATSEIRISSERSGENKTFNCFAPKSFSTCHPFWQEGRYDEIRRRIFIFETQKVTDRDFLSKEEINYNNCDRRLCKVLEDFWVKNQARYKQYVLSSRGEDRDILATLCCLYEVDIPKAKKMLKNFRDITRDKTCKPDTRVEYLESFLSSFIYRAQGAYARARKMGKIENPEIYIKVKASELTQYFKEGATTGIFDKEQTSSKNISELMTAKGYQIQQIKEGHLSAGQSWYWVKLFIPEDGGEK